MLLLLQDPPKSTPLGVSFSFIFPFRMVEEMDLSRRRGGRGADIKPDGPDITCKLKLLFSALNVCGDSQSYTELKELLG